MTRAILKASMFHLKIGLSNNTHMVEHHLRKNGKPLLKKMLIPTITLKNLLELLQLFLRRE